MEILTLLPIDKFGIGGIVAVLILLIIYKRGYFWKNNVFQNTKRNIEHHPIFPRLKGYAQSVKYMDFGSEDKKRIELMRKILSVKFLTRHDMLLKAVRNKEKDIRYKHLINETETIELYTKILLKEGIPSVAVEVFNKFHLGLVKNVAKDIIKLSENKAYNNSPKLLEIGILDIYQSALSKTLTNVIDGIDSMNGDLTAVLYPKKIKGTSLKN